MKQRGSAATPDRVCATRPALDMPDNGSGRRLVAVVSRYPRPMKLSALAASLALAAFPAFAESVRVVDGDTLRVDGVSYRLWGIDAPEAHQACADAWPAGQSCGVRNLSAPQYYSRSPEMAARAYISTQETKVSHWKTS